LRRLSQEVVVEEVEEEEEEKRQQERGPQAAWGMKVAAAAGGGAKGSEVVVQKEAVENAVRFLNHPKVQSSPLGKRMAFLKHKGLNDAKIALALKRANITPRYDIKRAIWSLPTPLPPPPPPPPPLRPLLPLYPLSVRPF